MSTPLLATKLYIPPPRPNVVLRPRLSERLKNSLGRKLTLISAPAGFGKTTLISAWIAACDRKVAWLSLDEGDSDPTRFLIYFITALRTIAPTIGEGLLAVLQSPQPPPAESVLTALLNDITSIPDHFVLVLDDYHLIDAQPVDQTLTFLLDHLPPQMHLVITTRADPQLPLARLRVRDQMTELRAADLRFTPAEVGAFLEEVMGLSLSAAHIAALEVRTEGWIAGLQLAALSMQGHQDLPAFIRAFAGDNRYIVDYLVEEVLQRQPEYIRSFLLQTSILDRLHGSLCDAVSGQTEGSARLEALHRGNFFVVPLDDRRRHVQRHQQPDRSQYRVYRQQRRHRRGHGERRHWLYLRHRQLPDHRPRDVSGQQRRQWRWDGERLWRQPHAGRCRIQRQPREYGRRHGQLLAKQPGAD
jgi:LuxR family maltose regulon positive regulatory protein